MLIEETDHVLIIHVFTAYLPKRKKMYVHK